MNNKYLPLSALIISLGIITGSYLIALMPTASSEIPKSNQVEQNKVFINMSEASQLLGLSDDEMNSIITAERTVLETTGSFTGMMFPYVLIDGKYYFEQTKLLLWAQESATFRRIYNDGNLIR